MQTNRNDNLKNIRKNEDNIRIEKVNRARQLVKDGAYDSPKIIKQIVDKLLEEIG